MKISEILRFNEIHIFKIDIWAPKIFSDEFSNLSSWNLNARISMKLKLVHIWKTLNKWKIIFIETRKMREKLNIHTYINSLHDIDSICNLFWNSVCSGLLLASFMRGRDYTTNDRFRRPCELVNCSIDVYYYVYPEKRIRCSQMQRKIRRASTSKSPHMKFAKYWPNYLSFRAHRCMIYWYTEFELVQI